LIARARQYDKLINVFVDGILKFVHNGRIHAEINQIRSEKGGTVTGRFSMQNPNLQQIPAKGKYGNIIRSLFLPEEGQEWGSFDYSQQEPRLVVHYALKNGMRGAESLAEQYQKDPTTDFHVLIAKMAKITRKQAKTINLGLFYGMGKGKLQAELNLDKNQAKVLFDTYHRKVPFVKKLSDGLMTFATKNKLVFTLEDRFCRFDKYEGVNKRWNNELRKFEEWDPEA
jgi:DNA polymerase-1